MRFSAVLILIGALSISIYAQRPRTIDPANDDSAQSTPTPAPAPPTAARPLVLALGDSLTAGYALDRGLGDLGQQRAPVVEVPVEPALGDAEGPRQRLDPDGVRAAGGKGPEAGVDPAAARRAGRSHGPSLSRSAGN